MPKVKTVAGKTIWSFIASCLRGCPQTIMGICPAERNFWQGASGIIIYKFVGENVMNRRQLLGGLCVAPLVPLTKITVTPPKEDFNFSLHQALLTLPIDALSGAIRHSDEVARHVCLNYEEFEKFESALALIGESVLLEWELEKENAPKTEFDTRKMKLVSEFKAMKFDHNGKRIV
jgi:hypothetical protein